MMSASVAPIGHDARLPILEHVGELRARLIVCLAALAIALGFAFWQNHALLNVLNRPLAHASAAALKHSRGPLAQSARTQHSLRAALDRQRVAFELLAGPSSRLTAPERRVSRSLAATSDRSNLSRAEFMMGVHSQ
jgi:sec-independent protein translocase protein TatC